MQLGETVGSLVCVMIIYVHKATDHVLSSVSDVDILMIYYFDDLSRLFSLNITSHLYGRDYTVFVM